MKTREQEAQDAWLRYTNKYNIHQLADTKLSPKELADLFKGGYAMGWTDGLYSALNGDEE